MKHGFRTNENKKRGTVYTVWMDMIRRCHYEKHPAYKWYGQRGIQVCEKWRFSFNAFLGDMGDRPEGLSLDRINADGNYEPGNCRWATQTEQQRNRTNNKLTLNDAVSVIRSVRSGMSKESVAKRYGVSRALVRKIIDGKIWKEAQHACIAE